MVDRLMNIHDQQSSLSPEFAAMAERVLQVTELTSRLNALPFKDAAGRAELLERIVGRPLPAHVTIYPPFYTDHGLNLELSERVFVNQGCTFLDYAGIRIGARTMIGPKVTFITSGHPVDPVERRLYLTGEPIDVAENVWIGAGATILPGVTIGRDAVIAAGAIVAEDVPAQSLVAGRRRPSSVPGDGSPSRTLPFATFAPDRSGANVANGSELGRGRRLQSLRPSRSR